MGRLDFFVFLWYMKCCHGPAAELNSNLTQTRKKLRNNVVLYSDRNELLFNGVRF